MLVQWVELGGVEVNQVVVPIKQEQVSEVLEQWMADLVELLG
jgi:hypothetical protein